MHHYHYHHRQAVHNMPRFISYSRSIIIIVVIEINVYVLHQ
jgi:hypothetical protein